MNAQAQTQSAAKAVEAFYAKPAEGKPGHVVSIWVNTVTTKGAPEFDGKIDGNHVNLRIRNGANGTSIAVTRTLKKDEIKEDGYKEQTIGWANIVVNDRGYPVISIRLNADKEKVIWANVSQRAPQDLLVKAGLSLEAMAKKKAAHEASKAKKAAAVKAPEIEEEAIPF